MTGAVEQLCAIEYTDEAVGFTRRVLTLEDASPFQLTVNYASQSGVSPALGDVYLARLKKRAPGNEGWFADLGEGREAFVQSKAKHTEGELVPVRIKSEAHSDKLATARCVSISETLASSLAAPGRIDDAGGDQTEGGAQILQSVTGRRAQEVAEDAIDQVLSKTYISAAGVEIHIEPTRALVSVDVDYGGRKSGGSRDHDALQVNLDAAYHVARLLCLKQLSGLIVIDFLKMRDRDKQRAVADRFKSALERFMGRRCDFAPMSKFGLLELSVARRRAPVAEVITNVDIHERQSLDMLNTLIRTAESERAEKFEITVGEPIWSWLQRGCIPWREDVIQRIGPRFKVVLGDTLANDPYIIRKV